MVRALLLALASLALVGLTEADSTSILHTERSSAGDLEVGGELGGVPPGATRYIRYEDLLRLPQESAEVSDDTNFKGKTEIAGVALATLARLLGRAPDDALIVAICYDRYRTNYPRDYLKEHHPMLVLRINGQIHDNWPPSEYGGTMGPYLISHPNFKPAFKVLSHEDEPQIPFGVTRIEVRRESVVFGAIRPLGDWPANSAVEQGFVIARQDCFRCHNMGAEGGTMAGRSWVKLGTLARDDSRRFKQTIHDPKSVSAKATMPAHGDYDDATLDALTQYFKTFAGKAGSR
jgi:mono/diheme cytochrome c family protein